MGSHSTLAALCRLRRLRKLRTDICARWTENISCSLSCGHIRCIGNITRDISMPNLIINNMSSDETNYALNAQTIDLKYLYQNLIIFDRLAALSPTVAPASFRIGEPVERSFYDTNKGHLQYLQDIGIYRSWHRYDEVSAAQAVTELADFLHKQDGSDWLVHPAYLINQDNKKYEYGGFRVNLVQGLVFPSEKEDIDRVLNFKDERRSEFLAFWNEIYSISQNIDFDDKRGRFVITKTKLEGAINDLNAVSVEKWTSRLGRQIQIGVKFDSRTLQGIMGSIGAALAGQEFLAAIWSAASIFEVNLVKDISGNKASQAAAGLTYIADARKNFKS